MNALSGRRYVIAVIFVAVCLIYLMRLFYIQVINDSYKMSANNNVLRYMTEYPARGLVYDRDGVLLVYNEAAYDLMVTPRQVKKIDTIDFCETIGITKEQFIKKMKQVRAYSPYKESIFEKQLSKETYAALQEKLYKFKGFFVQARTLRKYPQEIAAHTLGYVGEVSEKITEKNPYYKSGDYIGISGIEKSYEEELRGKKGLKIMMVDVFNRPKGRFKDGMYDTTAISGQNLISSLSAKLQKYGEQLLQNKSGAIVAIDPSTGEILACVSGPSYNPNLLVGRERTKNYGKLFMDKSLPLFNRALMAYYPPGSTFKLLNGLIGEQEQVTFRETRYPCNRGYPVMGGKPKCHPHPSPMDLPGAVSTSCNSYFCYVFRSIIDNRKKYPNVVAGYNAWREYVLSFGVGVKIHTDLPQELPGNVPTQKYYDKYFGKNGWKSSTIVSLSIGQGELGVTPLQMANIICSIANKGFYYTPHIIKGVGEKKQPRAEYKTKHYTKVDPQYFEPIIDGMQGAVDHGTSTSARLKDIVVCGKTGTAQNPHGKDHSVFVAFAPRENPKIAVAVLVENGGWGATWAVPIGGLMIEKYLRDSISKPDMEKRMLEGVVLSTEKKSKDDED
ncbi:MAG TPA: penicillin-binding protein 2 [Bacteroidia bacterium]|nr:penicillin-binding protein 2 [Bacteroidia bacterium]